MSRAAAMAQVKAAGDPVRSPQDRAEVYSDMATVTSSAGESTTKSPQSVCVEFPLQPQKQRDMQ